MFGPQSQPLPDPEGAEGQAAPPAGLATAEAGGASPPAGGGTPRASPLGPSQSRLDLLDKLPSPHEILASNLRFDGSCFLEIICR